METCNHVVTSPRCSPQQNKTTTSLTTNYLLLCLAWIRLSIDLVGSRVLPAMRVQVDVEGFSTWQLGRSCFKGSEVQGWSACSEVRQRLIEVRKKSQGSWLVLEVQGRLVWEKVEKNYGVYICLSWEVWQRKWNVKKGSRRFSNTKKYSVKNILEKSGWIRRHEDKTE